VIVRCDSGARHYSKVRRVSLFRKLIYEADALATISQTIVLVSHCDDCGVSEHNEGYLANLYMDTGTTHI
jgi:hypothetical protein